MTNLIAMLVSLMGDIPQGPPPEVVDPCADHKLAIYWLAAAVVTLFGMLMKSMNNSNKAEKGRRKFAEEQARLAAARQGGSP